MIFPGHPARRRFAGWLLALAMFVAAGSGALRAQTPADGSPKWGPFSTNGQIVSSPAVGPDGTVYIGVYYDRHPTQGSVFAISPGGSFKWEWKAPDGIDSSPAVSKDGTIYVGCWDGKLYALNAITGTERWHFATGVFISTGSPAIGPDGTVYIGSGDAYLHAVSPSGTELWNRQVGGAVNSSPAVGPDGTVYFGSQDKHIYALNRDGSIKWSVPTGDAIDSSSPAIGADGTVYVGSEDGKLYAISPEGLPKWAYPTGGNIRASPVLGADGTIYFGATDRFFYALNQDGTEKWKVNAARPIVSSAAVRGDGTIIFGADDGAIRALNPANGTVKWPFAPSNTDAFEASPVVAPDGTIYVALLDGRLYALNGNGSPLSTYSSWPMFRHDAAHSGVKPAASTGGQLVNLSTRAPAGGGANLIAGLVVAGSAPKRFLLRGIGPTLVDYNVPGAMADPTLDCYAGQVKIVANDNWGSDGDGATLRDAFASVGAFPLPAGSKDAALVMSLAPGAYTAVVGSGDGGAGIVLAEAYDAASNVASTRLINLASRARVTATGAVIPGLVIGGAGTLRVLVRAVGPGLAGFGVDGVLARPTMSIFNGAGTILRSNTGWTSDGFKADLAAAAQAVGAFPLTDPSVADCAMLLTLNSGDYTIPVAGVGGATGEVLVEVYVVP